MADPLDALRSLMAAHSPPLHAIIVPSQDNHQSEYISDRDKRRQFISGFTGNASLALITMSEALLWIDVRCFLQATQELSDQWKAMCIGEDRTVETWITDNLPSEAIVGIDPWCVPVETAQRYEKAMKGKKQQLFQLSSNLVDEVWKDRPAAEISPVMFHPLEFAGRGVQDKLKDLREKLLHENAYGIIISSLDEIQTYFSENGIEIRDYDTVDSDVSLLASGQLNVENKARLDAQKSSDDAEKQLKSDKIWIDPSSCCLALFEKLSANQVFWQQSPLALAKALKNPIELNGLRKAQVRDGAAVVQFFVWLDSKMQELYGASGYFNESQGEQERKSSEQEKLTEVSVSDKLKSFHAKKEHFKGLSFPPISSVGSNAAILFYGPEPDTCAELVPDKIYLFDSGAQYLDGTTDITRTVHFGKPSQHEKACYTAVLKGHIALDMAVFPSGTTGFALDVLARTPLWKRGLDYQHGTGHGVGSFLSVHEGPHQISFRPHAHNVPLRSSMTVTDEPGYYEDGNFGMRLENVLVVKDAETKFNFADKGYLTFEHITWAPYQKKLMDLTLMNPEEVEWVNSYHSDCRKILAPYMKEKEME